MNINIEELIRRPLEAIERLRVDIAASEAEGDSISRIVAEALSSGDHPALHKIPLLSRENLLQGKLLPNSLVRYQGMIQDQYDPEYFIGSFQEVETATGRRSQRFVKYADAIEQRPGFFNDFEGDSSKTLDRRLPLFCIPVPGQSTWARCVDEDLNTCTAAKSISGEGTTKRQRDDGGEAMECEEGDRAATESQSQMKTPSALQKCLRANESSPSNGGASYEGPTCQAAEAFENQQELDLSGLPCLVKVYDFEESKLGLNNTAEFVVHRDLPACAPLAVDPKDPRSALYALQQGPLPFGIFMRETKRQAIEHLARSLEGDVLAAEYTLLTLLSRVYARTESVAPGSLTLSLSGVSGEMAQEIHASLSELVPKCARVPVTADSLAQKFKFSPRKDYEADRLMVSNLQLSEGTVVLLDETGLQPGQMRAEESTDNVRALESLIRAQKIPYDFGFYKMEFEVDHRTISLSSGCSVVSTMASVPVLPSRDGSDTGPKAGLDTASATVLGRLRVYFEATRRMEVFLDKSASARAEDDFVKARQQGKEVTGDDLHRWLTVARLTALSLGKETVTESHWNRVKDLEAQVAQRVDDSRIRARNKGVSAPTSAPASDGGLNGIRDLQ